MSTSIIMDQPNFIPTTHTLTTILATQNPFETIGLPILISLTDRDVSRAYRQLALQFHPDKLELTNEEEHHHPTIRQEYGYAFIKLNEAFQAIRTEVDRRRLINEYQEAAIWKEIKLKEELDQQEREDARRNGTSKRAPSNAFNTVGPKHSSSTGSSAQTASMNGRTADATAPPSAAFPAFSGAKFRPTSFTFKDSNSHSTATSSTTATSASAVKPRTSPPTATPPRTSFDVTSATGSDDFLAQLSRWKLIFAREMEKEREHITSNVALKYGSDSQMQLLSAQLGANVFSKSSRTPSKTTALIAQTTSKPTIGDPPSAAPSRLQQLRARQSGQATAIIPASTLISTTPTILPATLSLLTAGGRFQLRTVAATPGAKPTPAVPISLWLDSTHRYLQWRLVSSVHVHPDGVIQLDQIREIKRVQKKPTPLPTTSSTTTLTPSGWWSIILSTNLTLTLEATNSTVRDQWMAAINQLIQTA